MTTKFYIYNAKNQGLKSDKDDTIGYCVLDPALREAVITALTWARCMSSEYDYLPAYYRKKTNTTHGTQLQLTPVLEDGKALSIFEVLYNTDLAMLSANTKWSKHGNKHRNVNLLKAIDSILIKLVAKPYITSPGPRQGEPSDISMTQWGCLRNGTLATTIPTIEATLDAYANTQGKHNSYFQNRVVTDAISTINNATEGGLYFRGCNLVPGQHNALSAATGTATKLNPATSPRNRKGPDLPDDFFEIKS